MEKKHRMQTLTQRIFPKTTSPRVRRTRLALLLCLIVGWGVLLSAHFLAWDTARHVPFPGFTVEPSGVLTPFGDSSWARFDATPPLAEPERVIAVDDLPIQNNRQLQRVLRNEYQVGGEAFFTFDQPDGSQRTVLLPLTAWPMADFANIFLAPFATALVIMGLGTWVMLSQSDQHSVVFVLGSIAFAWALALIFDLTVSGIFPWLWIAAITMSGVFFAQLGLRFPRPVRLVRRRPWIIWLFYGIGGLLLLAGQLTLYHWPSSWAFIPTWRIIYLENALGMLFFLGMMVHRLRRPPSTTVRRQSRIILMGATLAFGPIIFWQLSNLFGAPRPFTGIYAPFALFFPLALAYAVLRYQLADVDAVFARGVTYGLMTISGVGLYLLLRHLLADALARFDISADLIYIALFILVLIATFDPVRRYLQGWVDRLFLRTRVDYRAALQSFSHQLAESLALPQVLRALGRQIEHTLHAREAAIWLYDDESARFRPHGVGLGAPPATACAETDPVASRIAAEDSAFFLEPHRYPQDAALAAMTTDAGEICVPLRRRERLIGWLLGSGRRSERPYTPDDLAFLSALADQSALAVENARLFAQMTRQLTQMGGESTST